MANETNEVSENQLNQKVMQAIHRIEDLYFHTNGNCYVSFSGGKDSTVLLALIKMSVDVGVLPPEGIKAVFINTGVEMQATIDFVKWCKESGYYKNIEMIRPKLPYAKVISKYGKPIKSKMKAQYLGSWQKGNRSENVMSYLVYGESLKTGKQFTRTKLAAKDFHMIHPNFDIKVSNNCCKYLKKEASKDYDIENNTQGKILGLRGGEGGARQLAVIKRLHNGGKLCTYYSGKIMIKTPIIDWTDEDVDEFIETYNVPLSRAYTEYGLKRTGCYGCPFALDIADNLRILHDYEPLRYKGAMHFLKDVYIAQNVKLPFDEEYEKERETKWETEYLEMRDEMLEKYRPDSRLLKKRKKEQDKKKQTTIDDFIEDEKSEE